MGQMLSQQATMRACRDYVSAAMWLSLGCAQVMWLQRILN
jgi:hypothetical protein